MLKVAKAERPAYHVRATTQRIEKKGLMTVDNRYRKTLTIFESANLVLLFYFA